MANDNTPIMSGAPEFGPGVRLAAKEIFELACHDAEIAERCGFPEAAERLRGRALGALDLRDALIGEPNGPIDGEESHAH